MSILTRRPLSPLCPEPRERLKHTHSCSPDGLYRSPLLGVTLTLYLSIHIYISISMYIYVYIYICLHIRVSIFMYLSIHLSLYTYLHRSIYIYIAIYLHISIYLSISISIFTLWTPRRPSTAPSPVPQAARASQAHIYRYIYR